MEHFEVLNPKSPRQMSSKYILLWFCMVKSFIAPLSSEEIAFVSDKQKSTKNREDFQIRPKTVAAAAEHSPDPPSSTPTTSSMTRLSQEALSQLIRDVSDNS